MSKKEKEVWTLGNTLKLSYAANVMNIKQSNLDRLVTSAKIRKVKVPFEKYLRVPLIDVPLVLQKEHTALTARKQKIEEYTGHLGEIYTMYLDIYDHDKRIRNLDISDDTIEALLKTKKKFGLLELQERA